MFDAFSEKKHRVVNVETEYDLTEIFRCPNLKCPARFKIYSATGKRAKHFHRQKIKHIRGCPFENGDEKFIESESLVKNSLDAIYESYLNPIRKKRISDSPGRPADSTDTLRYINTPNQLLTYCLVNSLNTEYQPGIRVDDIILDSRNLIRYGRFKGIVGLRIVIGETVEWRSYNTLALLLTAVSRTGKEVFLHIFVKMDSALLKEIRKYIIETYETYEGHPVAVLGKWKKDREYNISCEVPDRKHIMLKFK